MTEVGPISPARLKEILSEVPELAETLDLHSTFQWEHFLEQGVDSHFLARVGDLTGADSLAKASDYWKQVDYALPHEGTFTLPKDKRHVSIYSRRAFLYPQVYAYVKLPSLSLLGNETEMNYYLGFEHGSNAFNGIACFRLMTGTTYANRLCVHIGPLNGHYVLNIDVAKPSNFSTAYHSYRVALTKNLALFFIDSRLRAVAVQSLQGGTVAVKENTLPYSILLTPPMPSNLTTLMELLSSRTAVAPSDLTVPLSPYRFRVSDGKEIIPLSLPLYLENNDTALAGYSIASGSVTSHPFPIFGYDKKTILFQANQAGSLQLQVYTLAGNWRTYNSDPTSANTLYKYIMAGDAMLGRIVFTPNAYPCNVTDAEVVLG